MESFEANRYQPVTVPVLIDRKSLFIVARRRPSVSPLVFTVPRGSSPGTPLADSHAITTVVGHFPLE